MYVLVVEDDASCADVVQAALESRGYRVHTEADGRAALQALEQVWPDLLVLDVMLPEIDGLTLWGQVRAMQSGRSYLPVVMLTALDAGAYRALGAASGADEYLTKPFDRDVLRATPRRLGGAAPA